jgi:hypothetical protein
VRKAIKFDWRSKSVENVKEKEASKGGEQRRRAKEASKGEKVMKSTTMGNSCHCATAVIAQLPLSLLFLLLLLLLLLTLVAA